MTTDTNLSQIVFNRLSNEKYHELKTSGQLNDQQFYITPDLDTNPGLIQDYMSNCITKIPQHINLELSTDGTLTLKAGSIVYIPNGVGVFDKFVIQSDFVQSYGTPHTAGLLLLNITGNKINGIEVFPHSFIFSGTEQPSGNTYIWYNTTSNIIQTYLNGVAGGGTISLPIAEFTGNGSQITSIKVFNGFGYIGSTIFALPGVEGLIPNGRNNDGSLNSIKFATSKASIQTVSNVTAINTNIRVYSNNVGVGLLYYDLIKNINTNSAGDVLLCANVGNADIESGRITSFNPKNVFQAVDRNELDTYDYVVEQGVTNGITWEKWRSGKLIQSGSMNVTITSRITNVPAITFPKPMSDTNYKVFTGTTYNSGISNVSYNITSGLQTSGLNVNGHSGNICAVDNTAMSSGTVKIWWRIEGQGA